MSSIYILLQLNHGLMVQHHYNPPSETTGGKNKQFGVPLEIILAHSSVVDEGISVPR